MELAVGDLREAAGLLVLQQPGAFRHVIELQRRGSEQHAARVHPVSAMADRTLPPASGFPAHHSQTHMSFR